MLTLVSQRDKLHAVTPSLAHALSTRMDSLYKVFEMLWPKSCLDSVRPSIATVFTQTPVLTSLKELFLSGTLVAEPLFPRPHLIGRELFDVPPRKSRCPPFLSVVRRQPYLRRMTG